MARNSRGRVADGGGTLESAAIACETCRDKKRKCDRALPVCGKCIHDPDTCHYPEQNKRGVPHGYLNKLETRLAETEAALFAALKSAHDSQRAVSAPSSTSLSQTRWSEKQHRVDRVKAWESLPLRTAEDIQAWFETKDAESDVAMNYIQRKRQRLDRDPSPSDQLVEATPSGSDVPRAGSSTGVDAHMVSNDLESVATGDVSQVTSRSFDDNSKAAELSRSSQSIYF